MIGIIRRCALGPTGISQSVPTIGAYRLSDGCTATAPSPSIVSGRVVAMEM